jgi:hypothetical protein
MASIRRGDLWRRELSRYLYGSTTRGPAAGGAGRWVAGAAGGESLDAVSVSADKLLAPLREWRRLARLEDLEAAGGPNGACTLWQVVLDSIPSIRYQSGTCSCSGPSVSAVLPEERPKHAALYGRAVVMLAGVWLEGLCSHHSNAANITG